jgi:mannose-6-phosphate isomerase-like protein (cupin superfamily)
MARRDEASRLNWALRNAQQKEREKWEKVLADKDARIAELLARLGEGKSDASAPGH